MKKALVLRSLMAAATLSLGSVALAANAGATNLTINMYVGANTDNASTLNTWGNTSDWSLYSDASNTSYGQWAAAYADCHSAANTDCTLREAVDVSNRWELQPTVIANINSDIAAAVAYDQTNAGGNATYNEAWAFENNMSNSSSTVSQDLAAGPVANGGYARYVINFTQLKSTYTLSSDAGVIYLNTDLNINIVGRGVNNTVITSDGGNSSAFEQDNANSGALSTLYLQDMTITGFTSSGEGSVVWAGNNATTTLQNVNLVANYAQGNGTIYSQGTVNLNGGRYIKNVADNGGVVAMSGGTLNVNGGEFSGNNADGCDGGAIYGNGGTSITVLNSSFDHNSAADYCDGGAIGVWNSGDMTVTNSTFNSNFASEYGGAIYTSYTNSMITNDTFVLNRSVFQGGALQVNGNSGTTYMSVGSSLFVNNTSGGLMNHCSTFARWRTMTSLGGNVLTTGTAPGCVFGSHDKFVNSIKLGAYGFHGGLSQTFPIVAKSAATSFAPRATCAANDARGVSRGTTGTCDAGAYQVTKK